MSSSSRTTVSWFFIASLKIQNTLLGETEQNQIERESVCVSKTKRKRDRECVCVCVRVAIFWKSVFSKSGGGEGGMVLFVSRMLLHWCQKMTFYPLLGIPTPIREGKEVGEYSAWMCFCTGNIL